MPSREQHTDAIPHQHLRACPDHGMVAEIAPECPACATGVEVRRDDGVENITHEDLRWQIEPETLIEVIPLMQRYLEGSDEGPMWVTVAKYHGDTMPAGYTEQERWFNVLKYRFGMYEKAMLHESNAQETIETLRDEGYDDAE